MKSFLKSFAFALAILYLGFLICFWSGGELMADMFLAASLAIVARRLIDAFNDKISEDRTP